MSVATSVLEMRGISKSFVDVPVLQDVDLDCGPGEVHAIVGENGAGKSTLMKILAGAYRADSGTVRIDGEEVHFAHPHQAQAHGVSIIYQEFNLLPDRSVAENIFVGREPARGVLVDRRRMERDTRALLSELGAEESIAPRTLVGRLSVAQQQTVEIAKALSLDARILVMDEPTAALAEHEVEALFAQVSRLQEKGLAVLYISHRLEEIFRLADRITVLKDGRRVDTVGVRDVTQAELVKLMVGRELDQYFPDRARPEDAGDVKLRVKGGATGLLKDIDLELRAGEIVGLAGLVGSGRTELARAIFGIEPFAEGTVEVDGKAVRVRSPRRAIRLGMGFITEDRKVEGLVLGRSVRENAMLALRSLIPRRKRGPEPVAELATSVELRARSLEQEVRFLSGGNQQKVVLAKWLALRPQILIFDEPTRGIDVGAKAGIHDLMRELARSGVAILMISSELPEVIGMSDRVLVMREGRIAGALGAGPEEHEIMLLATGAAEAA
jgi:ABC-type sugar transport system ATPase subunit